MGKELSLSPQTRRLLRHFYRQGHITQRQALIDLGIQSLTKQISLLRDAGFQITTTFRRNPSTGQKYAKYSMQGRG